MWATGLLGCFVAVLYVVGSGPTGCREFGALAVCNFREWPIEFRKNLQITTIIWQIEQPPPITEIFQLMYPNLKVR
jgi:hypothetical protein